MDFLLHDLRFAIRFLRRRASLAAIAILSLALGIGANSTIFSLVNEIFLRPLPIEDPSRVVTIFTVDQRVGGQSTMSHLNWEDVRDQNNTFSSVAGYDFAGMSVAAPGNEPEIQFGLLVSGNYFSALGVKPREGRFFLPDEDEVEGSHPVVVLHHDFWTEDLGADPEIVGQTLRINGHEFTVIGVSPPGFDGLNVGIEPSLYVPMAMNRVIRNDPELNWYEERRGLFINAFGRLAEGVSHDQALANLGIIATQLEEQYPDDNEGRGITIVPVVETMIFNRDATARGSALLMAVVGLVLLIACANVASLLLAQASQRRKEIALRLAMGVGRMRLLRQLMVESLVIALAGGGLGLALAYLARAPLGAALGSVPGGPNLAVDLYIDSNVLLFTLALSVVTGILFGLFPALQASKPELVGTLKDQGTGATSGRRVTVRHGLVVGQIALALVALIGAALFARSLSAALDVDLGYETENLIALGFNVGLQGYSQEQGEQFFERARERIATVPGVESAALAQSGPLQGTILRSVYLEGENPEERTFVQVAGVGPRYFETTGIELVRGRAFTEADRAGAVEVVIVNEQMAETYWPGQDALGKRFNFFGRELVEVVGIAPTIKYNNPAENDQGYAYLPIAQYYTTNMNVVARTSLDAEAVLTTAERELRALDPDLVINARSARTIVSGAVAGQRTTAALLAVFGGVALLLAAIGIYGVMSFVAQRRFKEIGIRFALGAQKRQVLTLVLREGVLVAVAGLLVGLGLAFATTRIARQLLFVDPADPLSFATTGIVLFGVALVASLVPALRAARVDPMTVLRND